MRLFKKKREFSILTAILMVAMIGCSSNSGILDLYIVQEAGKVDEIYFRGGKSSNKMEHAFIKNYEKIFIDGHEVSRIIFNEHLNAYKVHWKGGYNPERDFIISWKDLKYTLKDGVLTIDAPLVAVSF